MIMANFISPREAAKKSHKSLNAIYTAVWTGRLRAEKCDGRWLISEEAVDEFLQRRRSRDPGPTPTVLHRIEKGDC
jgi:hypothetical protein